MDPNAFEDALTKLEYLAQKVDVKTDHGKAELLMRARNLASALLDPYVLFHTKIVVSLVKEKGGDRIDEVAAWLHDIGRAVVDKGHREVGAAWAERWVKKFYITDEEVERILDGIRNHGVNDQPKTKTGKLLKLVDALAVFDPGWATMVVEYNRKWKNSDVGEKLLLKKLPVIKELGNEEEVKWAEGVLEVLGIAH
ncbi:MAG: hypothetical protein GXN93_02755 [Candidatus Diapherotrites archaeon]|nr:hypothetical protein [Candidatus Diapherotrites archaeon]